MSFTTQSESVPLVDATRLATGCPLIFTGPVSTSDDEREHVGAAGGLALVVHEPVAARSGSRA